MLTLLNRHLVQPLVACRRRSRHLQYWSFLERSQYETREQVEARQLAMLQAQLHHAFATVPYYQQAWKAAGVHPSDVRSLADLKFFPILTKQNIREAGSALISTAFTSAKLRTKKTSGSTGVPLVIKLDEQGAQWKTACTLRSDEWSGWRLGERVAKVWGNPEYRHFGLRGRITNALVDRAIYLDTIHLDSQRLQEFVGAIRRHQPGLIFGHAHSLYLVASALEKAGIQDIRPNGIISTAMPLHDYQRKVIERVFAVPATNRYGCEEVSLIASECNVHHGLHVAAESIYTEVRGTGETGPILVTDLSNFAMPLIRYQTGDVITMSSRTCPCGRGLPLIEKVEGRDADYVVTPAGKLISGISLTENFAVLIRGAAQVQIIQETLTHLRVRMVVDHQFTDQSREDIRKLVLETFGQTMNYDLELVDVIPQEASGKYRFCISRVAREHLQALSA